LCVSSLREEDRSMRGDENSKKKGERIDGKRSTPEMNAKGGKTLAARVDHREENRTRLPILSVSVGAKIYLQKEIGEGGRNGIVQAVQRREICRTGQWDAHYRKETRIDENAPAKEKTGAITARGRRNKGLAASFARLHHGRRRGGLAV